MESLSAVGRAVGRLMTAMPAVARAGRRAIAGPLAATLAVVAVPVWTGAHAASTAQEPATHTVSIDGTSFAPATLTVRRGERVVWINKDPFPHTATAAGSFESGSIAAGASWRFTPRTRGTFDYICTLHPNMKGTLVVR